MSCAPPATRPATTAAASGPASRPRARGAGHRRGEERAPRGDPRRGGALGRGPDPGPRAARREHLRRQRARGRERDVRREAPLPRRCWPRAPASCRARRSIVGGDFNVTPADVDVYDPAGVRRRDARHARGALAPGGDHRRRRARRRLPRRCTPRTSSSPGGTTARATSTAGWGCGSTCCSSARGLASRVREAGIDRDMRKGTKPSDHAPLLLDLADG